MRVPRRVRLPLVAVIATLPNCSLAASTPLAVHIHSEKAMFQVLISPGAVGPDNFVLQLMSGDGTLLSVKDATLILSLPGSGIEPLIRKAVPAADGYWHVDDVDLPTPGGWHMRIDATTPFRKITLEDDFDLPPK